MSKKDLLDILYNERGRLRDVYLQPGWTNWAVLTGIASVGWVLLNYIEDISIKWQNVFLLYFFLENICLLLSIPKTMLMKNTRPIWGKSGGKSRFTATIGIVFFFGELVFFFCSDFVVRDGAFYVAAFFICAMIVLLVFAFVMSYVPSSISSRFNSYAWGMFFVVAPIFAVLLAAFIRSYHNVSVQDIRCAVLVCVMAYLLSLINVEGKKKLESIDNLIEETLMDGNPDEKMVLRKLDECVRGLRVGDFLFVENADYFMGERSFLIQSFYELDDAIRRQDHVKETLLIREAIRRTEILQKIVKSMLSIISNSYGEDIDHNDRGLRMTLDLLKECTDLSSVWLELRTLESNSEEYLRCLENAMIQYPRG